MKNKYDIRGRHAYIFLERRGKFIETVIDIEDLELVDSFPGTWSAVGQEGKIYARGEIWEKGKRTSLHMHRLLMQPTEGMYVDHINRNKLDNRRSNLRVVTKQMNHQNTDNTKCYYKMRYGFAVYMHVDRKTVYCGLFKDEEEAKQAAKHYRALYLPGSMEAMAQPWYRDVPT